MTSIDYEKFQFITTVQTSLIAHILSKRLSMLLKDYQNINRLMCQHANLLLSIY